MPILQYISFEFQITYHEVEPSGFEQNADSSSIYVAEEYFSLSNLQPGRNYSISVQAVSKGIESVQRSLFQATRKYRNFERVWNVIISNTMILRVTTTSFYMNNNFIYIFTFSRIASTLRTRKFQNSLSQNCLYYIKRNK